jgi:hypothetical protein
MLVNNVREHFHAHQALSVTFFADDIFIAHVSYHHAQRSTLSSRVHARSLQSYY